MRLWVLLVCVQVTRSSALSEGWVQDQWDCTLTLHNSSSAPEGRGQVTSRGYPEPFPGGRLCERHVLTAPADHLVEVRVTDVDLHPLEDSRVGCLSLFLRRLDNDNTPPMTSFLRPADVIICHNSSLGHSWFSDGRHLALEFTSAGNPEQHRGFAVEFSFISRGQFVTRGQRLPGDACRLLLLSEDRQWGHIYSEGFPVTAPSRNCSYTLYGERRQRVVLTAVRVGLQPPDSSCVSGDRVVVYDGTTERTQAIAEICRTGRTAHVTSSGPYLHVASHVDGHVAHEGHEETPRFPVRGFQLLYRFEDDPAKLGLPPSQLPSNFDKHLDQLDISGLIGDNITRTSVYLQPETPCETSCHRLLLSDTARTGEVRSPGHPLPYPANILCRYEFQGKGNERIILRFEHFDLGKNTTLKTCRGADSVSVFGLSGGRLRLLRRLCGSGQPSSMMSSDHRMLLMFTTGGTTSGEEHTGFRATYRFVENYGLSTGLQLSTSSCAFEFRSSLAREGSFGTPNAPGFYPADTDCHFYFIGGVNETVLIQFSYFDVEGIYPCLLGSASDYLEVDSGQELEEGPLPRYCGDTAPPNPLISDGARLRLTFHSNGRFDATGFSARYRFISRTPAPEPPAASTGAAELRLPQTAVRLLLAVCVLSLGGPG